MTQPTLFPLDALPRVAPNNSKAALHAFCRANGILTHTTGDYDDRDCPAWAAVKVPPKRLDDGKPIAAGMNIAEMFAWFGRLLDEGGWAAYGHTEREAVELVCQQRDIPFTP